MDEPARRHYRADEVQAIFQETARRQAALQAAGAPGLTLEELQEVARNAGLDPALVAAAAAHLAEPPTPTSRFWNLPDEVRDDRVLPGTVTDELWERIVDELRRAFGASGQAGQVGRIREWFIAASGNTGAIHVEARPEGDQTRIVLTQSLAAHRKAVLTAVPTVAVLGLIMPFIVLAVGGLAQWPVMLLIFVLHFLIASGLGFGSHRTAKRQLEQQSARFASVLDRIDLLALRSGHTHAPAPRTPIRDPQPPLAHLHDEEEAASGEETHAGKRRDRA